MVSTRSQGQPLQTPLPDRGRSRSPARSRTRSNSAPGRYANEGEPTNQEEEVNNENSNPNTDQAPRTPTNETNQENESRSGADGESYGTANTSPDRQGQRDPSRDQAGQSQQRNFDPRFAFHRPFPTRDVHYEQQTEDQGENLQWYRTNHNVRAAAQREGAEISRIVPMRPMDVAKDWFLDYCSPTTIKFFNKAIERLPGEKFDGKGLYAWLNMIHDKAITFAWIPILTIKGKLLTKQYSSISIKDAREHAQAIQNEGRRRAQNSEMLISCLKASISKEVYTRVNLLSDKYTITREPDKDQILDGVCYLKTIIDCYQSNTRSTGCEIRKNLARLPVYMIHVAKGDVVKLCGYAREQLNKLHAAGEDTHDLLSNLIQALRKAPDVDFTRWLDMRFDLWSTRQLEWNDDGTDLMDQAEEYYLELKQRGTWGRRRGAAPVYAYEAQELSDDDSWNSNISATEDEKEVHAKAAKMQGKKKPASRSTSIDSKYKWKLIPPKDGEAVTKKVSVNDVKKVYHWCEFHQMWTIHDPMSCKREPTGMRRKSSSDKYKKSNKQSEFRKRRKDYLQAKAALQALSYDTSEDNNSGTESGSTEYYSDSDDSNCS